jgi:hypothetical protein
VKKCRRMGLSLYMDGKGTNCLSLGDCVWCDVCKEVMENDTESENMIEIEKNIEIRRSEMDVYEWSRSIINEFEENMMVADEEKR